MTLLPPTRGDASDAFLPVRPAVLRCGQDAMLNAVASIRRRLLRVPLFVKLVGANVLVAVAVSAAFVFWQGRDLLVLGGLTLVGSLGLSALLVRIALGPLDELEAAAQSLAAGEATPPFASPSVADARFVELRESFSRLLERVEHDRARIQQLARLSIQMREVERASLADQLREATAQELSALGMHLAAASARNRDPQIDRDLASAWAITSSLSTEIGSMADAALPGLIGELGLPAALEALAGRVRSRSGIQVTVEVMGDPGDLPLTLTRVLFRVAEEAARNAEAHAKARTMRITLLAGPRTLELRVEDDGAGFDAIHAEQFTAGVGLFRVKELLAHAGGQLQVTTAPGQGATITAIVPVPEGTTDEE